MTKFLLGLVTGFLVGVVLILSLHAGAWSYTIVDEVVPEIQQVFRRAIDAIKPKPARPEMEWRISL